MRCVEWKGQKYPSLEDALDVSNTILHLAPERNGEVSYAAFEHEQEVVGLPLTDLAEGIRGVRMTFGDLTRQVKRLLISPCWTGMVNDGRAYSAWCMNVERLVPWRTLTGRQQLYMDHPWYIDFGEHFMTYKPKLDPHKTGDIVVSPVDDKSLMLNYLTPHGKWHIHSTYGDNQRMLRCRAESSRSGSTTRTRPESRSWTTTGSKSITTTGSWSRVLPSARAFSPEPA